MTYELAKELKEAGFLFRSPFLGWTTPSFNPIVDVMGARYVRFDDEWFFLPTLTELIEALGEKLWQLRHLMGSPAVWSATSDGGDYTRTGPTPEIAAARLWLALNPKKV